MRSLSPYTTFVGPRTVSPTLKLTGYVRNCSDSILSRNAWVINRNWEGLECWSIGVLDSLATHPSHHAITPPLHHSAYFRSNPAFVLSFDSWPVADANFQSRRGCRRATLPAPSSRGIQPAACIADIPTTPG